MAASIRELADEASFIFEGTLRRTKAVTSLSLQPTDEMAVVHVDRILEVRLLWPASRDRRSLSNFGNPVPRTLAIALLSSPSACTSATGWRYARWDGSMLMDLRWRGK